nr:3-oxo-tetronate kinase [uncultured Blautia sp.]
MLGCIADDFTGASDAASFLAKRGIRTILLNGTPDGDREIGDAQAVVVALKTRTMETAKAVEETLQAAAWLKEKNAQQIYIKYCSTFDSTREGNIGPIMDALLETYHIPYSVLCPSLPVNGRTVENGRLYVNGVPLDESPMKNHPLTPMWDSDLVNLMEAQSRYKCVKVGHITEENQKQKIDEVQEFQGEHDHFYIIPDYSNEEDARNIVKVFGNLEILSGGSGLLEYLAEKYTESNTEKTPETATDGKALLLAGSCSVATRNQIAYIQEKGVLSVKMDPIALMQNRQSEEELWNFIRENPSEVLVYSSDDPQAVKEVQKLGKDKAAVLLERTTANLAKRAVENGFTRIIVAGGETSGAVTKALGYDAYEIGESVAPGVPVMTPLNSKNIRLVLKSGNFGDVDFMEKALKLTGKDKDHE